MIAEVLGQFEPESEGLLREISAQTSDQMLERIARADYGQDVDKHLAALRPIRDTSTFPKNMVWFPGEVLELFRYSEPERDLEWGEDDEFMHWARAFSCAALLRATRDPWNYGDGSDTVKTAVQLIYSLRALPIDLTRQAAKFFAWLLLHSKPEGRDSQVCAYGIALLWLALQLTPQIADETLISLTKWLVPRARALYADRRRRALYANPIRRRIEAMRLAAMRKFGGESHPLRIRVGNPPPSPWDSLGAALFDLELGARAPELKELIQQIGLELVG